MMMAINRTRGTAIGGALFVSLLISGNSVSTVEANCLTDKYTEIIRSDTAEICQTYTIKKGMNYSLPGYYMYKAKDLSVENVVMNEEKIFNLKKLDQIAYLEDTWEVFEVSSDGQEKYSSIEADVEAIAKVVNSFYG